MVFITDFSIVALVIKFLLPFSLGVLGLAIVSLTIRGQSNRTMAIALSVGAFIVGFFIGLTIQNSWLAYDLVYVKPFVEISLGILGGDFSLPTLFEATAFFVVLVQIAGVAVALFNFFTTIGSDETALVQ